MLKQYYTKYKELVNQIIKFILTGALNFSVDAGVLYLLVYLTDITAGGMLFLLNTVSFSIAVANSYLINKYWTFKDKSKQAQTTKFAQFIAISVIGGLINSAIIALITTFFSTPSWISEKNWVMIAKVLATSISLVWNFIGYRYIVFKKAKK